MTLIAALWETLLSTLLDVSLAWVLASVILFISERSRRAGRSYEDGLAPVLLRGSAARRLFSPQQDDLFCKYGGLGRRKKSGRTEQEGSRLSGRSSKYKYPLGKILRPQDGASFTTWDGILFTCLTNAHACKAISEHDLGHGVSAMGGALHLLQRDLLYLAFSKPGSIDGVQNPKGAFHCLVSFCSDAPEELLDGYLKSGTEELHAMLDARRCVADGNDAWLNRIKTSIKGTKLLHGASMGPVEAFTTAWRKSFTYGGKATRVEYWWFYLMNLIVALVILAFAAIAGKSEVSSLLWIYWFAQVFPSLSIMVRRLRDIGKKWTWIFINLVPFIGGFWFIYLLCQPSGRFEMSQASNL